MTGRRIACYSPEQIVLEPFELPDPGPGELLLRTEASLISPGTELSSYYVARERPGYPGYTAVGRVEAVGEGLDGGLLGRRVFVFPAQADSQACHASHKLLAAGGLALPVDDLEPGAACFARMINIALTPFCHAPLHQPGPVAVFGLGLVGQFLVRVAGLFGRRAVGIDPDAPRRARAESCGAETLDPTVDDVIARLAPGAALSVDATGRADVFPTALASTAPGGEVCFLGGARTSCQVDLAPLLSRIIWSHVTVRGGWEMLLPRRASPAGGPSTEANLHRAFGWLRAGAIDLDPLWTQTIAPQEFGTAYASLAAKDPAWMGVVVDWSR